MEKRSYQPVLLFMGVMSVIGLPEKLKAKLEEEFGPIDIITEPFDFSFTDYYVPEMGEGIKRFFISFTRFVSPDELARIKTITNSLEKEYAEGENRKINLDPGIISEANLILATTKNRSHRIAIGMDLYAEVTLIYQNHGWQSFSWTYADYRSDMVQQTMTALRKKYLQDKKNH